MDHTSGSQAETRLKGFFKSPTGCLPTHNETDNTISLALELVSLTMATRTVTTTTLITRVELVANLEIAEYDKAGVLKATYVESTGVKKGSKRVDVLVRMTTCFSDTHGKRLIILFSK